MKSIDRHGRILFTDISAPLFDPSTVGKSLNELMAALHARRLSDGAWSVGVDSFRVVYETLGFRRAVSFSRLPVVSSILAWSYRVFAANRLRFRREACTDRCALRER